MNLITWGLSSGSSAGLLTFGIASAAAIFELIAVIRLVVSPSVAVSSVISGNNSVVTSTPLPMSVQLACQALMVVAQHPLEVTP